MGEIKPSFSTNRQKLGEVLPLRTPFTVIIDVSEYCNFRCKYCFRSNNNDAAWGYAKDASLMSLETFDKILYQLKSFSDDIKVISLSNHGEPLCNPKIPIMIKKIKDMGFESQISLHTNASLLRGDMLEGLLKNEPGRIVISWQGMSDLAYEETCDCRVSTKEMIKNIGLFYKNKKDTLLCVKVINTALKEGEDKLFYDTFLPIADRVYIEHEVDIWKGGSNIDEEKLEVTNKYGDNYHIQKVCPVIFHTIVIAPNGDVYPCTQLCGQRCLGNINDDNIVEMWNGDIRKFLLMEQLLEVDEKGACVGCGIKQNSFFSDMDIIDPYIDEIYERLCVK